MGPMRLRSQRLTDTKMSCDEGTIQTIRIQEDHVQILNRDDGSRAGQVFMAAVADRGWIELPDGSRFASPSPAA